MVEKLLEAAEAAVETGKVHTLTPGVLFGWDDGEENCPAGHACLVGAALTERFGGLEAFGELGQTASQACEEAFGVGHGGLIGLMHGFDGYPKHPPANYGPGYEEGWAAGVAFRAKHADKVATPGG